MPKKWFKQISPDPVKMRANPALNFLGTLLHDPNLFHLNRHSVSGAFFVGLFITFLPIPGQVPLAAFAAILIRCNLPISVALVWLSNPLTFPFIFLGTYMLGARILQIPHKEFNFELSWAWFAENFHLYWEPLLLGCVLASLFFGSLGYVTIQWFWRWNVVKKWQERKNRRSGSRD